MILTGTKEKRTTPRNAATMTVSKATSTLINLILNMPPKEIIETLHELQEKKRKAAVLKRTEVVFAVDNRFCKGLASTIHSHGLYIETQERFSPGENITLSFEHKKNARQIKTSGKVIRVDTDGMEVEFATDIETYS